MNDRLKMLGFVCPDHERDIPFSREEYASRLTRIRAQMHKTGIDMLWVSAPDHMCYVSGYRAEWYVDGGPDSWEAWSGIAIHADHDFFIHFDIEDEALLIFQTSCAEHIRTCPIEKDGRTFVVRELEALGWLNGTVGLEFMRYRPSRSVSTLFQAQLENAGAKVIDGSGVIRPLRRIKSNTELAVMNEAHLLAEIGMAAALSAVRAGISELDVYAEMTYAMAKAGGEPSAIPLPVVAGPRAASAHALASKRIILPNEVVNIDVCGVRYRYHSNVSRTCFTGEPSPALAKRMTNVVELRNFANSLIKPGLPVRQYLAEFVRCAQALDLYDHRWWFGGYELGIAMAPDWVGGTYFDVSSDAGDAAFDIGFVSNMECACYLPDQLGITLLIDTFSVENTRAGFVHGISPNLHLC